MTSSGRGVNSPNPPHNVVYNLQARQELGSMNGAPVTLSGGITNSSNKNETRDFTNGSTGGIKGVVQISAPLIAAKLPPKGLFAPDVKVDAVAGVSFFTSAAEQNKSGSGIPSVNPYAGVAATFTPMSERFPGLAMTCVATTERAWCGVKRSLSGFFKK